MQMIHFHLISSSMYVFSQRALLLVCFEEQIHVSPNQFSSFKSTNRRYIFHNLVQYEWNRQQFIITMDFFIFACQQIFMLYEFCIRSQNIVDENKNLLDTLKSNHLYLYKLDEPYMKNIVERLEKFTGFSALNYFNVNKSLLTSIVANFLTYLIVLIQFGMSASSSCIPELHSKKSTDPM